jgi:hypothetical protein
LLFYIPGFDGAESAARRHHLVVKLEVDTRDLGGHARQRLVAGSTNEKERRKEEEARMERSNYRHTVKKRRICTYHDALLLALFGMGPKLDILVFA